MNTHTSYSMPSFSTRVLAFLNTLTDEQLDDFSDDDIMQHILNQEENQ
jgi:hypothetical protein